MILIYIKKKRKRKISKILPKLTESVFEFLSFLSSNEQNTMSQLIQIFKEGGLYIEIACTTHGTERKAESGKPLSIYDTLAEILKASMIPSTLAESLKASMIPWHRRW